MTKPETTRRAVIAGIAAAPVAGLPALARGGELLALGEAYRDAHEAFLAACDDLGRMEEAWKEVKGDGFHVPSLLGGGLGSVSGREECKEFIAKGYEFHRERTVNIARIAPDLAEQMRVVLDAKEAENMALIDAAFEEEHARKEAIGLLAAERRWGELCDAEESAALALCAYGCQTWMRRGSRPPSFWNCRSWTSWAKTTPSPCCDPSSAATWRREHEVAPPRASRGLGGQPARQKRRPGFLDDRAPDIEEARVPSFCVDELGVTVDSRAAAKFFDVPIEIT